MQNFVSQCVSITYINILSLNVFWKLLQRLIVKIDLKQDIA